MIAICLRNIILAIILAWVSYTDIKRKEIDYSPIIIGLVFALIYTLCGFNNIGIIDSLIGGTISFAIFYVLCYLGMGGGDLKLMTMVGLFLGWKMAIIVMLLAFMIGGIYGILKILFTKTGLHSTIAFGPSIAIASSLVILFGNYLMNTSAFYLLAII